MKDYTDRIAAAVRGAGGKDPIKVGVVSSVGWAYVRYADAHGLRETRWGTSFQDLLTRIESWARKQ